MAPSVEGELIIDDDRPFEHATVFVRLHDTSRAGGKATLVSQQVITGVSHRAGAHDRLKFALPSDQLDSRRDYMVSAHVSLTGDHKIASGDYITMQAYPVCTFGRPQHVSIEVKKIG